MPEIVAPEDMLAEIRDLQRRIKDLETAPQSNRVSLLDGQFRFRTASNENVQALMATDVEGNDIGFWSFVDDSGVSTVRTYLGTGSNGLDGTLAISNRDNVSMMQVLSSLGVVRPVVAAPWQKSAGVPVDANGYVTTTSGSYVELFVTYLNATTHVNHQWTWDVGGGVTSAAFKVTAIEVGGSPETTVYEQTGITVDGGTSQNTALPSGIAVGALPGRFLEMKAYMRVTGGAGTVGLTPFRPAYPST